MIVRVDRRQSWELRASWDGAVAVLLSAEGEEAHERRALADAVFDGAVTPMASALESLSRELGGYGRGHVVLGVAAYDFELDYGGVRQQVPRVPSAVLAGHVAYFSVDPIRRWTDSDLVITGELLDSMKRELLRGCGIAAWEA